MKYASAKTYFWAVFCYYYYFYNFITLATIKLVNCNFLHIITPAWLLERLQNKD